MSYTPTNWVNGETPINAENLNKIEQELVGFNRKCGDTDISGIGDGTVTGAISALNGNLLKYNSFEFNLEAGSGLTQNVVHRIDFDIEEILSVYVESIGVSNNYSHRTQLTAWALYSDLLYMDFYGDSDVYIVKIGVLYK